MSESLSDYMALVSTWTQYEPTIDLLPGESLCANDDGTVTLITANGGEHTYDPELVFPPEGKTAHDILDTERGLT